MPSSRGSSQPRDGTQVSCTAGGFFPTEPPGKTFAWYQTYTDKKGEFRTLSFFFFYIKLKQGLQPDVQSMEGRTDV